jgi:hypothetical protein
MQTETKTRAAIAALIYPMTNALIFGTGLIVVLTLPTLRGEEVISIPTVVVVSLILAAPAAWVIAPRLRVRHRRLQAVEGSPATLRPRSLVARNTDPASPPTNESQPYPAEKARGGEIILRTSGRRIIAGLALCCWRYC